MTLVDWSNLAAAIVVAACTFVYAFLTWRLLSETRKLREVQTEPRVGVQVEPNHPSRGYDLVIRNTGQGAAQNVRFEFLGDPTYFRDSFGGNAPPPVNQLPVVKDGLVYMEPGYTLTFPLGTTSPKEFDRATREPWEFRVEYENLGGKRRKNNCLVDFSQFKGQAFDKT